MPAHLADRLDAGGSPISSCCSGFVLGDAGGHFAKKTVDSVIILERSIEAALPQASFDGGDERERFFQVVQRLVHLKTKSWGDNSRLNRIILSFRRTTVGAHTMFSTPVLYILRLIPSQTNGAKKIKMLAGRTCPVRRASIQQTFSLGPSIVPFDLYSRHS